MKNRVRTRDEVQSDYLAALDRLLAGRPLNETLRAKADVGKLRINPSSVALEAGRSRTLIAHAGSTYSKVRDAIRAASASPLPKDPPLPPADAPSRAQLEARIQMLASINAALLVRSGLKPSDLAIESASGRVVPINPPKRG